MEAAAVSTENFSLFKSLKTLAGELTSKVYQNFKIRESHKVNYEEQGYLDALARLLHVQSDCSAIFYNKEESKLYISFNSQPTELSKWKCTQLIDNLSKNLEDAFAQAVLFSYTYSNTNFSPNTKKYFLEKAEESTVARFVKELRELDKTCVGAMEKKQQEKKEYTSDLQKTEGYEKIYSESDAHSIINLTKYHKILEELKTLQELKEDQINIIKKFLRPIQDVFKISKMLEHSVFKLDLDKIVFVDNKESLHAEIVMLKHMDVGAAGEKNLGIAKLACVLCEDVLGDLGIQHRGTHGTLYAGQRWKVEGESKDIPTHPKQPSVFTKMITSLSGYTKEAIGKLFETHSELTDENRAWGAMEQPTDLRSFCCS